MAMPLLPHAHAASLLRRDATGRTLYFPVPEDKACYVVPDVASGERVLRQLRRIRFVELTTWVLFLAVLITAIAVADGVGVSIPKWLFVLGFLIAMIPIQLLIERARRRSARGLVLAPGYTPKPSLIEKLPAWAVVLVVALAVGLAFYFGRLWPLKVIAWLEDIPQALHESKALAKVVVFIGGATTVLWGGVSTLKKWLRSSVHRRDPIVTDDKK
jgi:hypothetical protein